MPFVLSFILVVLLSLSLIILGLGTVRASGQRGG